jgi:multidrug resistance efflux pump
VSTPATPAPATPSAEGAVATAARPAPPPEAPTGPPAPTPDAATEAPARRGRVRLILLPIVALIVAVGAWQGYEYWWNGQHYVSTENAQVSGQQVQVGSMNAGRLTEVDARVGGTVRRNQLLAVVQLPSQVGVAQNGTPKMDFLPDASALVEVRSPIDGVVIATPGAVGSTVAQGQSIVTLVDPAQLWVTANVDETQVPRLRVGQSAEVFVDALTPATAASFSLIPSSSNTTTNFTKVTQVVPVRVAVSLGNEPGLLGSSASVRIRVE